MVSSENCAVHGMLNYFLKKLLGTAERHETYPAPEMVLMKLERERILADSDYDDFVRVTTLELISHEIHNRNIEGACAELGVYKGEFARLINILFPERKLYLFDTFTGFDAKDLESEKKLGFFNPTKSFKDTSLELVLKAMQNRENCVIKKGFFPETSAGIDGKFSFVSIDADLHDPVLAGLEFFYPRLSEGGYIMVHDYNNSRNYPGPKAAIEEFSQKNKITFIPLCDLYGSVVIKK